MAMATASRTSICLACGSDERSASSNSRSAQSRRIGVPWDEAIATTHLKELLERDTLRPCDPGEVLAWAHLFQRPPEFREPIADGVIGVSPEAQVFEVSIQPLDAHPQAGSLPLRQCADAFQKYEITPISRLHPQLDMATWGRSPARPGRPPDLFHRLFPGQPVLSGP